MICPTCGNEVDAAGGACPFCGRGLGAARRARPLRTVNLERGRPDVATALERLRARLASARREGVAVVKLIHGYGSSGTGGALKGAVRGELELLRSQGKLAGVVPGEEWDPGSGPGRALIRRHIWLEGDDDLGRGNAGITLAVLR